jgi:hypothetical protein
MVGGDEHELEEAQAQMVAKVDFVNNTIATELLALVNDWYDTLVENGFKNKTNKFLQKNGLIIRMIMEIFIIFAGLALFYPIAAYFMNTPKMNSNYNYLKTNFILINGVFLSYTIFMRISNYYARKYDNTITQLRNNPIFNFTVGDKNELEKIEKKNKGLRREIYMKLIISFLSTGILYFLGCLLNWLIGFIKDII